MGGNGVICKHSTEDLSLGENKQGTSLHIFTDILLPSKSAPFTLCCGPLRKAFLVSCDCNFLVNQDFASAQKP